MAITVVWGEFITHDMAHTPQMTGTKTLVLTSCFFTLANRAALQYKCTQAENNGVNFIETLPYTGIQGQLMTKRFLRRNVVAFCHNSSYMLRSFAATIFCSYIKSHHQADKVPKKICYVQL
jgi:hypothetical protein